MLNNKALAAGRIASGVATDPNFKSVVMLLHGDGTNGAQNNTFTDGSTNNFTITRNGNPTQGTFSPYSPGWSNYFDGSGDYLTIATNAAFTYSTGDFTIETWVRLDKVGANQYIIDQRNAGTANAIIPTLYVSSGNVLIYFVSNAAQITGTNTLSVGVWYHVAVSRSGTSTRLFLNGVQEGSTYSDSNDYGSSRVVIGSQADTIGNYIQGYISNLRIVKGTAVYTAAFTPPTAPLTAITNTSLLTCQSNRLIDNSSNAFTITRNGDVSVRPFNPFNSSGPYASGTNGGSGYFDGTGDYLTIPSNTSLEFGSGDFTVEAWVYLNSLTNAEGLICINYTGGNGFYHARLAVISDGSARLLCSSGSSVWINTTTTATGLFTVGRWYHIAGVRNGSNFALYVNGVSSLTYTSSSALATASGASHISAINNSGTFVQNANAYISNVRVIKGTAVYTSNFTPPTAPLTAITNTSLLLNFTNGGIIDNAMDNVLETVGNAQISTSVKQYGTGSLAFDGSGDWLLVPDSIDLRFGTGAFTVECWLYLSATGAARGVVGKGTGTTGWLLSTNSSNNVVFTYGSTTITSTGTLAGSTWYHIAVVREGTGTNQTKIYINGTNDGTGTVSTDFSQTNAMYVGADRTGGSALNGYIDDLRITKGVARYTANFTPPVAAFPDQ